MPNEKAAEPLSEEKLADNDLERIEREGFTFADVRALLAEVRLGREALKALDAMEDAYDHVAHCRECGETSVQRCAESEGENSAAAKAIIAREECSRILRKAGRR